MNSSFSVKLNCVRDRVHSTHLIYVVYVDFFFFFQFYLRGLFLAALGLCCCTKVSLGAVREGCSLL